FLPRKREAEVDERRLAVGADDDVRRLDVAVQKRRAMQNRELIGGERDGLEALGRIGPVVVELEKTSPLDQFAHEERPVGPRQPTEPEHARRTEPFETRERNRLATERLHFASGG